MIKQSVVKTPSIFCHLDSILENLEERCGLFQSAGNKNILGRWRNNSEAHLISSKGPIK